MTKKQTAVRQPAAATRLAMALLLLAVGACHGANVNVHANSARYPVSMSSALPDAEGKVLIIGYELQPVGPFRVDTTKYGFFYGSTKATLDLSDDINNQIERAGGEGIVQFKITTANCGLNYFFPFTILPFWPGCQNMTVRGIIVRRDDAKGTQ